MKGWMVRWFPAVWRDKQRRFRVAGEYRALATSEHLLADLCIRNGVFAPSEAADLYQAGVNEGRRRCVLEILELTRTDPRDIAELEVQTGKGETR